MNTKKLKAIELVFDWNLWPRYEAEDLDSTNLKRMKDALRAGIKLPPVLINKKDYRIVDGFHRTKAALSVFGDGAEIDAEIKDFQNDAEMFLESARLNSIHGLPLSPQDRVHVIIRARRYKIPIPIVAEVLGMDKEKVMSFLESRRAYTKEGESIPLPSGASSLAGKTMSKGQEELVKGINGMKASSNAKILLNELKAGVFIINDNFIVTLRELNNKITEILEGVAA